MLGDALAMAVMQARGFNEEDFARSHPAGALGARLLNKVHHLMRRDDDVPRVDLDTRVMDAMLELSRTGLGLVAVCDAQNRVQGVFTDGDLRRWLVGGGTLKRCRCPGDDPQRRHPAGGKPRGRSQRAADEAQNQRRPGGRRKRPSGWSD